MAFYSKISNKNCFSMSKWILSEFQSTSCIMSLLQFKSLTSPYLWDKVLIPYLGFIKPSQKLPFTYILKELDTTEQLHFFSFYSSFWRRKCQPTPLFLPGESHGRRGLVGCNLWGCTESDMTRQLTHTHGVLEARMLKWFAIPFTGPHFVRPPTSWRESA